MQTNTTRLAPADRVTAAEMAAAMVDGLTTKEDLVPVFGKSTVDRLGTHAADLARKTETVN